MESSIYCDRCHQPIDSRADLVVAPKLVIPVAFHRACYADTLVGFTFVSRRPLNSTSATLGAVLVPLVGLFVLSMFLTSGAFTVGRYTFNLFSFPAGIWLLAVLAVAVSQPLMRLYSYYHFERRFL